jgi:uncharacterized protein YecA (UPF0149 family)
MLCGRLAVQIVEDGEGATKLVRIDVVGAPTEADEQGDAEDEAEEEDSGWFSLCPCGSGRLFSRCCGRKAFRKSHTSRGG